jgi:YD repeat-containing protein
VSVSTLSDVLGREIRKSAKGFDGSYVNVDTEYDNLGRVKRKSEPAYAGATQYWSTITYDLLGRATQATLPDSSTTSTTYNGGTDFSTVTTNGLLQTHTEDKNAAGQLVEVTDHLGGKLNYIYDAQGNMKSVTAP